MTTLKYHPSTLFLKLKDKEDHRHHNTRIGQLMASHGINERAAQKLALKVIFVMAQEYDEEDYGLNHYTLKTDWYIEELCKADKEYISNLIKS